MISIIQIIEKDIENKISYRNTEENTSDEIKKEEAYCTIDLDEFHQEEIKEPKKKKKYKEKKEKHTVNINVNIDQEIIDRIKMHDGKTEVTVVNPVNSIESTYTYKNGTKNFYYYQCKQRPKCEGKAKFNKANNVFTITENCEDPNIHCILEYDTFVKMIKNNKINNIDFKVKKNQKHLLRYL